MKKYFILFIFFILFTSAPISAEAIDCQAGSSPINGHDGTVRCYANNGTTIQPANTIAQTVPKERGEVQFESLSGLEKISDNSSNPSLSGYLNIMFTLLITVSTMLAVLFIAIAGVKYMATDLIGVKESAKGDIYSALIGLLLILSSVIILETINPCIVNFNILETNTSSSCSTSK